MKYGHLTTEERYTIEKLKSMGYGIRAIARALRRDAATISRELQRYGKRKKYDSVKAARRARVAQRSCANGRRISNATKQYVISKLKKLWSPEQIAGTLRLRNLTTPASLVSPQWIYSFVHKDKKSGGKLYTFLRCTKKRRKRYGTGINKRGSIPNRRDISERPAAVDCRCRIGDWEGDLIIGAEHHQAIVSLVERFTRYAILIKIGSKQAAEVTPAIINALRKFSSILHTLTLDNGKEFIHHQTIEKALGITVYFAKPYASYQRGLNENTNGLVRQPFPKGKSFDIITKKEVKKFEKLLNNRPRKCLGFLTPYEVLSQAID
jgi:transposase, IS30 family